MCEICDWARQEHRPSVIVPFWIVHCPPNRDNTRLSQRDAPFRAYCSALRFCRPLPGLLFTYRTVLEAVARFSRFALLLSLFTTNTHVSYALSTQPLPSTRSLATMRIPVHVRHALAERAQLQSLDDAQRLAARATTITTFLTIHPSTTAVAETTSRCVAHTRWCRRIF